MGKLWGGGALIALSAVMLMGFLRADIASSAFATTMAFLITVALPAGGGAALLKSHFDGRGRLGQRREELRRQTLDSEVLKLAAQRGGKLTIVEVVSDLGVPEEAAKLSLDELHRRDLAEMEVTDSGLVVYRFRDIEGLGDKALSRGILE